MKLKRVTLAAIVLLVGGFAVALASEQKIDAATDAWLRQFKLGPYQEPTLYELALKEGEVTVYAYTSRIHDVAKSFMQRYPGITVHVYDMDTPEIISKVLAEQAAGRYEADLIWVKDPAVAYFELYVPGIIFGWIPPHVAHLVPDELKEPLLRIHHVSLSVWFYNTEVYSESPITNIWDVTRPEWRGRVILPDIVLLTEYIATFASIIYNADAMAAAYERAFGQPIVLSRGVENAGYEWIKRVLENDAIIVRTTHEVTNAIGAPGQKSPPVGLSAFSRLRDMERNPDLKFGAAYGMTDPVFGFLHTNVHGFVNRAPHPNAAKLFFQFQMGDDCQFTGSKPYQVLGNWLVRVDAPVPSGAPKLSEISYWDVDSGFVWDEYTKIVDFWMLHRW